MIAKTVREIPSAVPAEQREALEADLVGHAQDLDPVRLLRVCQHALRCLDQDGKRPNETEREAKIGLVFGKTRLDGLTPIKGIIDAETKAALQSALLPLARPCPSDTDRDTRSQATRNAHALRDLALRALANGSLPKLAGLPATLLLATTLTELESRTGLVSVLSGGTIPVEDLIRDAAGMNVVPIVYTAQGQPLWCGQTYRLATTAIRHTTAALDRGCVIPGCSVPVQLCQEHHFTDFAKGGITTADDMGWVCPYHHRRITGWTLERSSGRVRCTPPVWLDPTQTPKLNTYFHPPDLLTETDHHAAAATTSRGTTGQPGRTEPNRSSRDDETSDPQSPNLFSHYY